MNKQKTQVTRESKSLKTNWIYYTEKGERKRKLKLVSFEGIEAQALYDAHEHRSTDITSSYRTGRNGSAVFEFFMEETLD